MLSAGLNPTKRLSQESVVSVTHDELRSLRINSHSGMRRQSRTLRLAIKQATNAKPVSQANKPQMIIVQANIT